MSGLKISPSCRGEPTAHDQNTVTSATGQQHQPITHTMHPIVTGSSVVAMRCVDGVVLAADTLASYGSLARFRDVSRIYRATDSCVIGAGGDMSDFDEIKRFVHQATNIEYCHDDGHTLSPRAVHQYLARIMYNRRMKFNPLWNKIVIAGVQDGEPVLALVDLVGTHFESNVIATGFGTHIGLPLLRKAYRPDITVEEAKVVITDIMRALFYRDARTIDRIQISTVTTSAPAVVSEPFQLDTKWDYKAFVDGTRVGDDSSW